ncbi:MAG: acyl-CoA dehydrogenase domain-containing protein, partial [Acidobacteriota bacterium]
VWASARLALWSDLAMAVYGGGLKLRGKLTGRFADALSWCYLTFAALRRFEAEGRRQEDLPLVRWAAEHGLSQIQEAFEGIFANFEAPLIGPLARGPILWWARLNPLGKGPSDRLGGQVAQLLQRPGDQRDRLTSGLFIEEGSALGTLERALRLTAETAPLEAEVRRAMGDGRLPRRPVDGILDEAEAAGILDAEGRRALERAAAARREAVRVDDFSLERLRGEGGPEPKQAPDSSNITDAAAGG